MDELNNLRAAGARAGATATALTKEAGGRIRRIETFARLGLAARGVVYLLIAWLALSAGQAEGTASIFDDIRALPAGRWLLGLIGAGLLAYGLYRAYDAAMDLDGRGSSAKGLIVRIGHGATGLFHLVIGWTALTAAFANRAIADAATGSGGGAEATRTVAALPGGNLLLVLGGLVLLAVAALEAKKAITADFMRRMDPAAPASTKTLGRLGHAARGVVFATVGWLIARVALGGSTRDVGGSQAALETLRDTPWLFYLTAAGLGLFGLFSLVMARYRRINDEDVVARLQGVAHSRR